jgi:hypothetical protein
MIALETNYFRKFFSFGHIKEKKRRKQYQTAKHELGGVCGLATDRCTHPPLVSCILFATFYKDLARRSRAREKKNY